MNIALVGYGRMGLAVEVEAEAAGHRVVARFDPNVAAAEAATLAAALDGDERALRDWRAT